MPRRPTRGAPGFVFVLGYVLLLGHDEVAHELLLAGEDPLSRYLLTGLTPPTYLLDPEVRISATVLLLLACGLALWWAGPRIRAATGFSRFALVTVLVTSASLVSRIGWLLYETSDKPRLIWFAGQDHLAEALRFGVLFGAIVAAYLTLRGNRSRGPRPVPVQTTRRGAGPVMDVANWPNPAEDTEATRLLSGAAYLEGAYAEQVVRTLLSERIRAVAPSPGVDLRLVVLHCLTALRLRTMLRLRLTGALVAGVLLMFATVWMVLPTAAAAAALLLHHRHSLRVRTVDRLRRDRFVLDHGNPDSPPAWAVDRLRTIDQAEQGNVTIFSGFRPHVGYGAAEPGWSFALPVLPKKDPVTGAESAAPKPFTEEALTAHVRRRLAETTDPDGVGAPLPALHLENRCFADGSAVRGLLVSDRTEPPAFTLPDTTPPTDAARRYLCAHIPSWGGQVVASTFLRFTTDGHMLYAECDRTVAKPINARLDERDFDIAKELGPALRQAIPALLMAPLYLVADLLTPTLYARARDRERALAAKGPAFDYGTPFSIREAATAPTFTTQFQHDDAAKHLKLVERHTLEAVIEFLELHDVDTTELRSRQTTILNEGVIQTGGTSNVGALAVGQQAQATTS
ncbi:hypothetical protein [Actinokineospora iranica]|uniref:Uncharacterized protein n=1 Tax=Actinokineospora iranica TaxID=1271860 RepID=A0A1G6T7V5_9PSEU|nr:hypothetical protein [Actinokineospora iranica]SDD25180.1 hypothetical protein SAMN05216174_10916 [Actinokineospora iranica]